MIRSLLAAALAAAFTFQARGHEEAEQMAAAAEHFLAALTPEQKAKATFEFKDEERYNYHFIPRARKGLPIKEMTPAQRLLAYALLNSAMSQKGYAKATTIMSLEQILHDMENNAPHRDPEMYFFSIFAQPSTEETWGWRVEGHHLSLNFTVAGGHHVAVTPSFFGTNPAEVRQGPRKGLRVLGAEEDLGRALVRALTEDQRKTAVLSDKAPDDIVTSAQRKVNPLSPDGLPAAKMTQDQSSLLMEIVREYVGRYRSEIAENDLEKIAKAGWDKVSFAWAGSLEPGERHYYRVQGPTFLLEYDNTQNNANHIHAVWRDFANDFGEDLLKKHYEEDHH